MSTSLERLVKGFGEIRSRGFRIFDQHQIWRTDRWFQQCLLAADYLDDIGYSDVAEFMRANGREWHDVYVKIVANELIDGMLERVLNVS